MARFNVGAEIPQPIIPLQLTTLNSPLMWIFIILSFPRSRSPRDRWCVGQAISMFDCFSQYWYPLAYSLLAVYAFSLFPQFAHLMLTGGAYFVNQYTSFLTPKMGMSSKHNGSSSRNSKKKTQELSARVSRLQQMVISNPKWINPPVGTFTSTITSTNPYVFSVNAVSQGTSENTRIGSKIRMKSFEALIQVQNIATAQQDSTIGYRLMVIREKTCLGSNIAASQVFLDANPTPLSMRDHTNRDASRYQVMYDSGPCYVGCTTSALASPFENLSIPQQRAHRIRFKCDVLADMSRANNGNVGDIDTNNVSFLFLSDNTGSGYLYISGAFLTQFFDV